MTLKHFVMAFKSSYGLVGVIGTAVSFAGGFGLSRYFEFMPGWVSGLCVVVAYLAGYIVACYQLETIRIEEDSENTNSVESTVTLADHEAAIERETATLRAAIEEKDAEISRLKELVESNDRVERERALRDMMDDYFQSGAEDVAVSPQPTADAQYDEAMRWMGRQ